MTHLEKCDSRPLVEKLHLVKDVYIKYAIARIMELKFDITNGSIKPQFDTTWVYQNAI